MVPAQLAAVREGSVVLIGTLASHDPEIRDTILNNASEIISLILSLLSKTDVNDLNMMRKLAWCLSIFCGATHPRNRLPTFDATIKLVIYQLARMLVSFNDAELLVNVCAGLCFVLPGLPDVDICKRLIQLLSVQKNDKSSQLNNSNKPNSNNNNNLNQKNESNENSSTKGKWNVDARLLRGVLQVINYLIQFDESQTQFLIQNHLLLSFSHILQIGILNSNSLDLVSNQLDIDSKNQNLKKNEPFSTKNKNSNLEVGVIDSESELVITSVLDILGYLSILRKQSKLIVETVNGSILTFLKLLIDSNSDKKILPVLKWKAVEDREIFNKTPKF